MVFEMAFRARKLSGSFEGLYSPRNDPQVIFGMAFKHGNVDSSIIRETDAIIKYRKSRNRQNDSNSS